MMAIPSMTARAPALAPAGKVPCIKNRSPGVRYRSSIGMAAAAAAPAPIKDDEAQLSITDYIIEGAAMSFEPIYRVILHYTNWTDHKDIARVVHRAVPTITRTHALQTVENAAAYGSAIVVTAPLDEAEMYEARLTRMGMKATLEVA